jgi:hypothetical protein
MNGYPLTLIRFASFFVILGSNNTFSGLRNYPSPQTNTERTHLPLIGTTRGPADAVRSWAM